MGQKPTKPAISNWPQAPQGVSNDVWFKRQQALKAARVPDQFIMRIRGLRQMNLWVWLVLVLEHPWKLVADNEEELLKKSIDKSAVRFQGKRADGK